jgi:hypothetical protein
MGCESTDCEDIEIEQMEMKANCLDCLGGIEGEANIKESTGFHPIA